MLEECISEPVVEFDEEAMRGKLKELIMSIGRIRGNDAIEMLSREIRIGEREQWALFDGRNALMLVTTHLKYVADGK